MKRITLLICLLISTGIIIAQSVGINNTGALPDSSGILDIKSNNKGILLPRVHLISINDSITINKPAVSLLVFNTNTNLPGGAGYYVWNGKSWDIMFSTANVFVKGKNRYTTIVDGDTREYWVSVPTGYTSTAPAPVVFMLHGTSGNGEQFYNHSGWKEVGEDETLITVFPSSWRYCIIEGGEQKNTTKWNTLPDADWILCPGQTGKDDIKFLKKILLELKGKFNIDTTRLYLNGFSNGGQMAAKCSIEMSDLLAAVASNASAFFSDTVYVPKRKLPVLFQVGNEDYGPGNTGPTLPLSQLDTLISTPGIPLLNGKHYKIARKYIQNFGLDSNYTIFGDTSSVVWAQYHSAAANPINVFRYLLVKDLRHSYPNGDNHWMEAARIHWAWMRQFIRP